LEKDVGPNNVKKCKIKTSLLMRGVRG